MANSNDVRRIVQRLMTVTENDSRAPIVAMGSEMVFIIAETEDKNATALRLNALCEALRGIAYQLEQAERRNQAEKIRDPRPTKDR